MEWKLEDELGTKTLQSTHDIALAAQKILESTGDYNFVVLSPSEPVNNVNFIQACAGYDGNMRLEISILQGGTKTHIYSHEFPPLIAVDVMTSFYLNSIAPDTSNWTLEGEFGG